MYKVSQVKMWFMGGLSSVLCSTQSIVENLKVENDHLKTGSQFQLNTIGPTSSTSQPSGLSSLLGPTVHQPMGISLTKSFSLSLSGCKEPGGHTLSHSDVLTRKKGRLNSGILCLFFVSFYSRRRVASWLAECVFPVGWGMCTSAGSHHRPHRGESSKKRKKNQSLFLF